MSKNTNIIYKLAAVLLIIIGLMFMIAAWDVLLVRNGHSMRVLAMEMGGVVLCLGGYFLWHRSKGPEKDMAKREDATPPAEE